MAQGLKQRKIIILGAPFVGKTTLLLRFIENTFQAKYYPTFENVLPKPIEFNGIEYECEIIDTAGQDSYSIFHARHAIGIHGFILVYSVADRKSFELVKGLYDKIVDFRGTVDIPCVIVGSKTDLKIRQVSSNEGEELAVKKGAAWVETYTNANANTNVAKVFELCLAEIEKRAPRKDAEKVSSKCRIM